jgi:hypothetical protein
LLLVVVEVVGEMVAAVVLVGLELTLVLLLPQEPLIQSQ